MKAAFLSVLLAFAAPVALHADEADLRALMDGKKHVQGVGLLKPGVTLPRFGDFLSPSAGQQTPVTGAQLVYWTQDWCSPTCLSDLPALIRLRDRVAPELPITVAFVSHSAQNRDALLKLIEKNRRFNAVNAGVSHDDVVRSLAEAPDNSVHWRFLDGRELARQVHRNKDSYGDWFTTFAPMTLFVTPQRTIAARRIGWADWDAHPELSDLLTSFLQ